MAFRNRLALQTVPDFSTLSAAFVPIPGLSISVKANSTFYVDLRFYASNVSGPESMKFRIDGWTPQFGNSPNPDGPSVLHWTMYDFVSQTKFEQGVVGTPAENMEWDLPQQVLRGDFYIFGLIRNDTANDQVLTVSAAVNVGFFQPVHVTGGRLILFEILPDITNNAFSIMSNCGCCVSAELSCCQDTIKIQTQNPTSDIKWKINDGGNVYTGTFTTDGTGLGQITIGDGMDLPDGFIDAPRNFKIEFIETAPKISTFVECIDVEVVGGAYLAINQIGETNG